MYKVIDTYEGFEDIIGTFELSIKPEPPQNSTAKILTVNVRSAFLLRQGKDIRW